MYLEIAIGSPSNRGTLIPREKLKDYLYFNKKINFTYDA